MDGISGSIPLQTNLEQNYPNPFNPTTTISFSIVEPGDVKLNIYNFSGQLVSSLVDREMVAGHHTVSFDASNLSAGIYYYTLEADNMTMSNKMILAK
ncbi:MAG: T9SS type A sorting domain-containing protein [Candidatus Delongbacteria bacterium]|nr:T9SS type A sorting domain-containing protein [Candidatus Delongbacteria bacterium]